MKDRDEDLLELLGRELPRLDVDDLRARRIREAAHAELARAARPSVSRTARLAWRRVELALAGDGIGLLARDWYRHGAGLPDLVGTLARAQGVHVNRRQAIRNHDRLAVPVVAGYHPPDRASFHGSPQRFCALERGGATRGAGSYEVMTRMRTRAATANTRSRMRMPNCHNGAHSAVGRAPLMQEPTYCQMKSNLPTPAALATQRRSLHHLRPLLAAARRRPTTNDRAPGMPRGETRQRQVFTHAGDRLG